MTVMATEQDIVPLDLVKMTVNDPAVVEENPRDRQPRLFLGGSRRRGTLGGVKDNMGGCLIEGRRGSCQADGACDAARASYGEC